MGSILGTDISSGQTVYLNQPDRLQGLYVIGKPGSGKTTLLINLILQDIQAGRGACFLEPHGKAINTIISRLPSARERDVILLDPFDQKYAFGLNPFQCDDPTDSRQVSFTVSHVLKTFAKLFAEGDLSQLPVMSEVLQNTAITLIANPGMTITEIPLLLTNETAREKLIENVTNREVLRFWKRYNRMKLSDQQELAQPILNRVALLVVADPITLHIVGQSKTTLDFRKIMDEGKILLVKLSAFDEQLTSLIGAVIIGQLTMAMLSQADIPQEKRREFNLYLDDYQRYATPDFATFLIEARKFGIATTVTHEYRRQLDDANRNATFNLANIIVFQVSGEDAEELAGQFEASPLPPTSKQEPNAVIPHTYADVQNQIATELTNLRKNTVWVKIGHKEFIVETTPIDLGVNREVFVKRLTRIQEQTRLLYCNLRTAIVEEIKDREQYLLEPALGLPIAVSQHKLSDEVEYLPIPVTGRSHGSSATRLNEQEVSYTAADSPLTIRIQINEEPLTAHNLTTIISALTELHTKCWLIDQGLFAELIEYTQTRSSRFDEEAPLVITKFAYNSPGLIEFNPDPEKLTKALQTGIDAVAQTPSRLKGAKLDIQAKELDILLKEQESQSTLADKEQARQIGQQKAVLEKQMAQLEIERKKLALEKERLELQEQRLELEKKRVDYALETANKMIDILNPNADTGTKAMLARTLLSTLLQLGNGKGLELALPAPKNETSETQEDN